MKDVKVLFYYYYCKTSNFNLFKVTEIKSTSKDKKGQSKTVKKDAAKKPDFIDPLSSLGPLGTALEGSDPLSMMSSSKFSSPLATEKTRSSSFKV